MAEELQDFGKSFKKFMDQMARDGDEPAQPFFQRLLSEHFRANPASLSIVSYEFGLYQHPSLQKALEEFIRTRATLDRMTGYQGGYSFGHVKLTDLLSRSHSEYSEGPVRHSTVELGSGETATVIKAALLLVNINQAKFAILISGASSRHETGVLVEIASTERSSAEHLVHHLRDETSKVSVYRGKTLTLGIDEQRQLSVRIQTLPKTERPNVILPEGVLDRVERLTIHFGAKRKKLLAAGRHLKRGILLHGPPGTGKTYTAMYLAASMNDRTVLLLTGRSQGLIETACNMARALQPSMVVIEDVDLIAEERSRGSQCALPILLELLNQMDGLAEDCDVVFLLTTNRPEILEPALASRPGRVDQAVLIPLPDADCRRRLFSLYSRGMKVDLQNPESFVARTEGASAAFIKELMRRAALFACDGGKSIRVKDANIDAALHELVADGGALTRSLLGFSKA